MPRTDYTRLTDRLILVLVELAGGPVPLRLILKTLEDNGWPTNETTAIQALKRNPERFSKDRHGYYSLNLGNGDGEES